MSSLGDVQLSATDCEPEAVAVKGAEDVAELLVRTFQDLRSGRTAEGASLNRPDAVMSTAEAVNVLHAAALEAAYLDDGKLGGGHVARGFHRGGRTARLPGGETGARRPG